MTRKIIPTDHNVYILGAGFSREAGLPLIADFLNVMRDTYHWLRDANRDAEAHSIEQVLDFRLKAAASAYRVSIDLDNIEELFSLAAALQQDQLESDIRSAIATTLECAAQRAKTLQRRFLCGVPEWKRPGHWTFSSPTGPGQVPEATVSLYEVYLGIMCGAFGGTTRDSRNTIISFNYDDVVERSLSALGFPPDYSFKPKTVNIDKAMKQHLSQLQGPEVKLLKLHGSTNWAIRGVPGGKLTIFKSYDDVHRAGLVPLLVPPTWSKRFQNQLLDIWAAAIEALTFATRIVIIGYSMPTTDIYFKYLLAAGLRDNIAMRTIQYINPFAGDMTDRLEAVFRREFIERGIVKLIPKGTDALLDHSWRLELGRVPMNGITI